MPSVEVLRTYLEMQQPGQLRPAPMPPGASVLLVEECPEPFHRFLYREVGRRYHWRDRLGWTDGQIREYLADPRTSLYVLYVRGAPAGYFELRSDAEGAVEIAYFGLLPGFLGRGLGKGLLSVAVETAWARGASRVWLHTCTLDDPAALPNYLARGFTPFREERYVTVLSPSGTDDAS